MSKIMLIVFILVIAFGYVVNAQTDILKDPRDGKEYKIVQIGDQTWMAENIKHVLTDKTSKYYIAPDGDSNYVKYGGQYDWKHAMKVCPVGWHLPSKVEFDTLLHRVGNGNEEKSFYSLIQGGSSGFNSLMGGINGYLDKGLVGTFWSSTVHKGGALPLNVSKYFKAAYVSGSHSKFRDAAKTYYFSVRCIKD